VTARMADKIPVERILEVMPRWTLPQRLSIKVIILNAGWSGLGVTVTTRVEEELARAIDEVAREEGMDRSTVIRRFLSRAVRDWSIEKSLAAYEEGKLTLWLAAERCGLSLWEMVEEARKREVRVPYTLEELREDLKAL